MPAALISQLLQYMANNAGLVQLAMNERLHKQSPDEKMGMLETREKLLSRPYRPVQITGVGRTDYAPIIKVLGGACAS